MKTNKFLALAALVCGLAMTSCSVEDNNATGDGPRTAIVSFENQTLNADQYWIGEENANGVDNGWGGMVYPCAYTETPLKFNINYAVSYWTGYAISARTETAFANLDPDQYNNVTGKAHTGSKFCVITTYGEVIEVNGGKGALVKSLYFTNSSYTANSIINGDAYSGGPFEAEDWLKCTITGKKADGTTASVDIDLAKDGSYVKEWTKADLTSLGKVTELSFTFTGSRTGDYGLNTPSYICIDDVEVEYE